MAEDAALLFPSIGMFPWIMMGLALIFLPPDWPVRLAGWVRRPLGQWPVPSPVSPYPQRTRPFSWKVGAAFLVAQVAIPLRHLAYPGNVRWTEEGYMFSWRVLVTEKTGLLRYRVTGLSSGRERLVYPEEYLTPRQVERMAYQPDLILATAHIIRDGFIAQGHPGVEVRADAYVACNGRAAARLIDPEVNLPLVSPGLGPKDWILSPPE